MVSRRFYFVFLLTKGQILPPPKICPFARASQALLGRGAAMPRPRQFLGSSSGIANEPLETFAFTCSNLTVRTLGAAAAPTRPQPQLRRTRIALARSQPAKAGAQRGFCPQKPNGESGDVGAATAAVHIKFQ